MKHLLLVFFLFTSFLYAKLEYSIKEFVDYKKENPSFSFTPSKTVDKLEITIKKGKKVFLKKKYTNLSDKMTKTIVLKQKEGVENYTIIIKGLHLDQETIVDSFDMKGVKLRPITLFFKSKDVDVENRNVKFDATREIVKVEVTVYNTKKEVIYKKSSDISPITKKGVEATWDKLDDEILTININAFDKWGYWSGMNVNPFSVNIPHEEIEFASGKWNIETKQMPKMKDSYKKVVEAINKYGKALQLKLYIAGYTDTVGNKKSNLVLSEKRAKSIAKSFKKLGLKIPIFYQGFGESVLRRKTEDEKDEVLNRRAIYVLSSQAPAITKTIPSNKWKRAK